MSVAVEPGAVEVARDIAHYQTIHFCVAGDNTAFSQIADEWHLVLSMEPSRRDQHNTEVGQRLSVGPGRGLGFRKFLFTWILPNISGIPLR